MDVKTSYGAMSKALNASGRHMAFSMCEWGLENPWEWGNDVAQAWRMHGDHTGNWDSTAEVRAWAGGIRGGAAQSGTGDHVAFLFHAQVIAASAAIPAAYSGRPYGWNDMVRTHPTYAEVMKPRQRERHPPLPPPRRPPGHARDGCVCRAAPSRGQPRVAPLPPPLSTPSRPPPRPPPRAPAPAQAATSSAPWPTAGSRT